MTAIGADPQALEALAGEFRRASARIDAVIDDIARATRRARWDGPDAVRFEREWQTAHRVRLGSCASACRTLATRLNGQAADQRRASTPATSPAAPARTSSIPPLPRTVDIYSGSLQASLGPVGGSITGTLVLEHLGGDRVRVSHTDQIGAGLDVGVGTSGGLVTGDRGESTGSSTGVTTQLDGRTTRQWTVDEPQVAFLLAGLAFEASPIGLPYRATDSFTQDVDDVLSWFGVDTDLGERTSFPLLPDPDRVEHLVGVSGSLTGTATTAAALGGTGVVTGALLVGTSSHGERTDLVIEAQGGAGLTLSRALHRTLGLQDGPGVATASMRIETPSPGDVDARRRPTMITFTSTSPEDQVVVRVSVDPRLAGAPFAGAISALTRGDADAAIATVRGLRIPADAIDVHSATASITRSSLSIPLQGSGASIVPTGSHLAYAYR